MISTLLRKRPFIVEKFVYTDVMYLQPAFLKQMAIKILHKSVKNERKWSSEAQPASQPSNSDKFPKITAVR